MISVLHTWGRILAVAGGVLSVLLAVPAFTFGGIWRTCLWIAAFVLILGLSMLLEEQILGSAGVSEKACPSTIVSRNGQRINRRYLCCNLKRGDFSDHAHLELQ